MHYTQRAWFANCVSLSVSLSLSPDKADQQSKASTPSASNGGRSLAPPTSVGDHTHSGGLGEAMDTSGGGALGAAKIQSTPLGGAETSLSQVVYISV